MKKLVVTSLSAFESKYGGPGRTKIRRAIASLVKADQARGIKTKVFSVDPAPTGKNALKRWKQAVDQAYDKHGRPDYVLLVGAPDVVPHQRFANPTPDDGDPDVGSDLPYACDAPFSTELKDFLGPTRVVGRLPDDEGGTDPDVMVVLLRRAAEVLPPAGNPLAYALTASDWAEASNAVLRRAGLSTTATISQSPDDFSPVDARQLGAPIHLINCHGASQSPFFWGDAGNGPEEIAAIASGDLLGALPVGGVAAFECCFGGELYQRTTTGRGMAATYLREGAAAVLGSTNVAYGETGDSNDDLICADVICAAFLGELRSGATTGRALLVARQKLVQESHKPLSEFDLKTLAQFILLGDPSFRPFPVAAPTEGKKPAKKVVKEVAKPKAAFVVEHAARRAALRHAGEERTKWAQAQRIVAGSPPPSELVEHARARGFGGPPRATAWTTDGDSKISKIGKRTTAAGEAKQVWTMLERLPEPIGGGSMAVRSETRAVSVGSSEGEVTVAHTSTSVSSTRARRHPAPPRFHALIAREVNGQIVVRRIVSR